MKSNQQKNFEILPHTADVKLKALGKTKQELFNNALKGMAYILKPTFFEKKNLKYNIKKDIKVESADINSLLVDFLSEVLALSDIFQAIFLEAKFTQFSDIALKGKISGIKVGEFDEDIKAVTYHDLNIQLTKDNIWEAIVLFDI